MNLKLISDSTQEPLALADAKAQCRVDIDTDDELLMSLIKAARVYCEKISWRTYMPQTWEAWLTAWPSGNCIALPMPPLASVTWIKYYDTADVETTLPTSVYTVDTIAEPGAVRLKYGQTWPTSTLLREYNAIGIRFVCGYAIDEDVPENLKQAMKLLIGHWYENREAVLVGTISKKIEFAVQSLLGLNRAAHF